MFYAILRNTKKKELPPALISSETDSGLRLGILDHMKEGWECVFIVEGDRFDIDHFIEGTLE